jgi:hypothetical protein
MNPAMHIQFDKLYDRYCFERQLTNLSKEDFEVLVFLFPAILVVQADGHIDTTEVLHLTKLASHIAQLLNHSPSLDLKPEIRYLGWSTKVWRSHFLQGLIEKVQSRNLGNELVDILLTSASSSTGSLINNILYKAINPMQLQDNTPLAAMQEKVEFISADEKAEIIEIVRYLGLSAQPAIVKRVKDVLEVDLSKPSV